MCHMYYKVKNFHLKLLFSNSCLGMYMYNVFLPLDLYKNISKLFVFFENIFLHVRKVPNEIHSNSK